MREFRDPDGTYERSTLPFTLGVHGWCFSKGHRIFPLLFYYVL